MERIAFNVHTHAKIGINVDGKLTEKMASVPVLVSHLADVVGNEVITGFYFNGHAELNTLTNDCLHDKVYTAVRKHNNRVVS